MQQTGVITHIKKLVWYQKSGSDVSREGLPNWCRTCFASNRYTFICPHCTNNLESRRDSLASMIKTRFHHYKAKRLNSEPRLICDIAVLSNHIPKSVGGVSFGKCLFKPTSTKASDYESHQGVAIYHDKDRCVFVSAIGLEGKHNFGTAYA